MKLTPLNQLRRRQGWLTIATVAASMGVASKNVVSQFERGERPSVDQPFLQRYARALGASLQDVESAYRQTYRIKKKRKAA